MADGKWISGLTAATPLDAAARRVLSLRHGVVADDLRRVLDAPGEDPEDIHQLRVGTRRAAAALRIFALCLPAKVARRARKRLRRIRQDAGQARDWDVFLATLAAHPRIPRLQAGLDFLSGYALARRDAALAHVKAVCPGYLRDLERSAQATAAAVQPPDAGACLLVDWARPHLGELLGELERAAGRDLDDCENLHQVRIAGKRLRYAMEVFAGCFAPPFREKLYPVVEELQAILGRANDSFVALQRLAALRSEIQRTLPDAWPRYRPCLEDLQNDSERRLPQQRAQFLGWWDLWQQSGGADQVMAQLEDLQLSPRRMPVLEE